MNRTADQVEAELAAGISENGWRLGMLETREKLAERDQTDPEDFQKVVATHRGGYAEIVKDRAPDVFEFETAGS